MKTSENKEKKQLRELSEEELKEVTGGSSIDCSLPENKDKFQCRVKSKGPDATFQGLTWGVNSFDTQHITASSGWDDVIE